MKLLFDSKPSLQYPNGYWYAVTDDGGHDADGATVESALANLIKVLEEELNS